MPLRALTDPERATVDGLMTFYRGRQVLLKSGLGFITELITTEDLEPFVHSVKARIKSEESMEYKLSKKVIESADANEQCDITTTNFFEKINDSIGVRLLHLSFYEFKNIHLLLLRLFKEAEVVLLEQKAYTWDPEYQKLFGELDLVVHENPRYYTSVHYTIAANQLTWSAEIQVRTLAEELWGEVDHKFNYPEQHASRACRDQIRVLARQVTGCSTLVDSIYLSAEEAK